MVDYCDRAHQSLKDLTFQFVDGRYMSSNFKMVKNLDTFKLPRTSHTSIRDMDIPLNKLKELRKEHIGNKISYRKFMSSNKYEDIKGFSNDVYSIGEARFPENIRSVIWSSVTNTHYYMIFKTKSNHTGFLTITVNSGDNWIFDVWTFTLPMEVAIHLYERNRTVFDKYREDAISYINGKNSKEFDRWNSKYLN